MLFELLFFFYSRLFAVEKGGSYVLHLDQLILVFSLALHRAKKIVKNSDCEFRVKNYGVTAGLYMIAVVTKFNVRTAASIYI